jgi:hypothetical protein
MQPCESHVKITFRDNNIEERLTAIVAIKLAPPFLASVLDIHVLVQRQMSKISPYLG